MPSSQHRRWLHREGNQIHRFQYEKKKISQIQWAGSNRGEKVKISLGLHSPNEQSGGMRGETVDRQTRGRNHEAESVPPGGPAGRDHAPTAREDDEEKEGTGTSGRTLRKTTPAGFSLRRAPPILEPISLTSPSPSAASARAPARATPTSARILE